ncbi:MAG: glycosyltransferase, partial [Planctomycetota bacterium]
MPAHARVIVTTYNQLERLKLVLRGYLRQTSRDFNLVVADDGSTPETEAHVSAFREEADAQGIPVEYVWIEDKGFRRGWVMNEAVRRGQGEPLLVFNDGDCIPGADFVAAHIAAHEPRSFHVGGIVRLSQEASERLTEEDVAAGRHETLATPDDRRDLRRRARKSRWGILFRRKNRPKVFGSNMAFDRS